MDLVPHISSYRADTYTVYAQFICKQMDIALFRVGASGPEIWVDELFLAKIHDFGLFGRPN